MGRELRRVPADFAWPVDETWVGFQNPYWGFRRECPECKGRGYAAFARLWGDKWYGRAPFSPAETGSTPFTPDHPRVRAAAERNVSRSPDYYGAGEGAIVREARRLCRLYNASWSHHLDADDVAVLVAEGRLRDLTHGGRTPTVEEVNAWSLQGIGHDGINQYLCVRARTERAGEPHACARCGGDGNLWHSDEGRRRYEAWEKVDPPAGEAYQMWETVSEGSPISPPFGTPEELADWLVANRTGMDAGVSREAWLKFINGPGRAPSMVIDAGGVRTGVEAVVDA